jgi:hypothetical protein
MTKAPLSFGPEVANFSPKAAALAVKFLTQRDRKADAIRFALAYENYASFENYANFTEIEI